MTLLDGDGGFKMDVELDFWCPFCGGSVFVGKLPATGRGVVGHSVPQCGKFADLGAEDYMEAARLRMTGGAGAPS